MKKKWSRKYNKCIHCGTIKHPHVQHGYCTVCWGTKVQKKYRSYYKLYYKKYWQKNKKLISKKRHEIKQLCVNRHSKSPSKTTCN